MATALQTPNGTTTVASATRTNTTVNAPSGAVSGVHVVAVAIECGGSASTSITPPSGWVQIATTATYSAPDPWTVHGQLWVKAYAGEASWTWLHASRVTQAFAWAFTGVELANIQDVAGSSASSGTGFVAGNAIAPSITTITDLARLIIARFSWDGEPITPPSGWTERLDVPVLWTGDREWSPAGATGTVGVASGSSVLANNRWGIVMGALRPAAAAGTTQVTATRSTTWRVRSSVSTVRSTSWDVRTTVTATRATTWRVLARPEAARASSWDVRTQVAAQRSSTWNVDGTITQVTATRSTSWRTLAPATSWQASGWRVLAAVPTQRAASWDTRTQVTTTRSTSWDTRGRVTATRSASWDTLASVSRALATAWDVRTQVSAQRTSSWNVDSTMTQVTATRATSWRTLRVAAADRTTGWDTRATVANTRSTTWDVRTAVALTRTTKWRALARTAAARSTTWDTRELATATRSTSWRVQSELPEPAPPRLTVGPPRPSRYDAGVSSSGLTVDPPRPSRYRRGDPT